MDYSALNKEGLQLISQLAGGDWTDHNTHDPGITILEQLCFALTDLNYRAEFPVEDLMAEDGAGALTEHFYPRSMLTSGPVSLQDWRMLLLDIPGVRNVWIKPADTMDDGYRPRVFYDDVEGVLSLDPVMGTRYTEPLALQGLYHVEYILDEEHKDAEEQVRLEIFRRFHAHRSLGEDLYKIQRLSESPVTVEATIEITEHPDSESLLAGIYARIHDHISPTIRFYTLQEMVAKGYQFDQIMRGPRLDHGFLEKTELEQFGLRQSVRISDLIQLIMEMEGVLAVTALRLKVDNKPVAGTGKGEAWEWSILPNYVASLTIPGVGETSDPEIELWHRGLKRKVNWSQGATKFQALLKERKLRKRIRVPAELDQPPPKGSDRAVSGHQSILHQFPDVYGMGFKGLALNPGPERQAQARQLKAYLSFFDQFLANSFAQLGGVRELFGLDHQSSADQQTYFNQSLIGELPGFEELVDPDTYKENLQDSNKSDRADDEPELMTSRQVNELRQKRLTGHLLSRFAERFNDFSESDFQNDDQKAFLQNYPNIGYQRFGTFDYTGDTWDSDNVSGLEQRLCYLLGFPESKRRSLADLPPEFPGAFHLVEHILLRPSDGDRYQKSPFLLLPFNGDDQRPPQKDPYSLQVSFVFPEWLERFKDEQYWEFLNKTIREQTPAHLKIYVHKMDETQMASFEEAYRDWLTQIKLSTR